MCKLFEAAVYIGQFGLSECYLRRVSDTTEVGQCNCISKGLIKLLNIKAFSHKLNGSKGQGKIFQKTVDRDILKELDSVFHVYFNVLVGSSD